MMVCQPGCFWLIVRVVERWDPGGILTVKFTWDLDLTHG